MLYISLILDLTQFLPSFKKITNFKFNLIYYYLIFNSHITIYIYIYIYIYIIKQNIKNITSGIY